MEFVAKWLIFIVTDEICQQLSHVCSESFLLSYCLKTALYK